MLGWAVHHPPSLLLRRGTEKLRPPESRRCFGPPLSPLLQCGLVPGHSAFLPAPMRRPRSFQVGDVQAQAEAAAVSAVCGRPLPPLETRQPRTAALSPVCAEQSRSQLSRAWPARTTLGLDGPLCASGACARHSQGVASGASLCTAVLLTVHHSRPAKDLSARSSATQLFDAATFSETERAEHGCDGCDACDQLCSLAALMLLPDAPTSRSRRCVVADKNRHTVNAHRTTGPCGRASPF